MVTASPIPEYDEIQYLNTWIFMAKCKNFTVSRPLELYVPVMLTCSTNGQASNELVLCDAQLLHHITMDAVGHVGLSSRLERSV